MSRLPPLPPGLPPKPISDSFRPGDPLHENYFDRQERHERQDRSAQPMFHFERGFEGRSSHRPRSLPRYSDDSYGPPGASNNAPGRPPADVYRPPSSGFTFRYDAPPSISSRQSDSWRPASPPRHRGYGRENSNGFRDNDRKPRQRTGAQRGGPSYRGRGGPRMASEREFLRANRAPTPELMPGMDVDDSQGIKYKRTEDLSDSDEAEMDMSDSEDDAGQPAKKRAKIETKIADGNNTHKWSNPDPYTVLPPPDESQRKKKDVVKLIRKARVSAGLGKAKTETEVSDFISLDFGGELDNMESPEPEPSGKGVAGAPSGPRALLPPRNAPKAPSAQAPPNNTTKTASTPRNMVDLTRDDNLGSRKRNAYDEIKPDSNGLDNRRDPNLGSRKRSARDEILNPPPILYKTTRGKPPRVDGQVLKEWKALSRETGTPWHIKDHSDTASMGVWLHKEIVDFYEYVKPKEFEDFIRTKLVDNLRFKLKEAFPIADIKCFGSFPAGLYLPTADMDLVCVSDEFMRTGRKVLGQSNRDIRHFADFVDKSNLAINGTIDTILKAKVPLVKYVDRVTGLKVDISFENSTGLVANRTFQTWKSQYPAMPIIVTLVKHLLAMRGLNEPVNGGIGGFSVTCLVVSLLQNMPQVQSRSMIPEHHLGEILMEFFDLYGNQFDVAKTAIQFDPPGYVSKARVGNSVYRGGSQYKFSILDPNNPTNDISGGSSNTRAIRDFFSEGYNCLQKRMGELQYSINRKNECILGCLLAGNYKTFKLQRDHLEHIYDMIFAPP